MSTTTPQSFSEACRTSAEARLAGRRAAAAARRERDRAPSDVAHATTKASRGITYHTQAPQREVVPTSTELAQHGVINGSGSPLPHTKPFRDYVPPVQPAGVCYDGAGRDMSRVRSEDSMEAELAELWPGWKVKE